MVEGVGVNGRGGKCQLVEGVGVNGRGGKCQW